MERVREAEVRALVGVGTAQVVEEMALEEGVME